MLVSLQHKMAFCYFPSSWAHFISDCLWDHCSSCHSFPSVKGHLSKKPITQSHLTLTLWICGVFPSYCTFSKLGVNLETKPICKHHQAVYSLTNEAFATYDIRQTVNFTSSNSVTFNILTAVKMMTEGGFVRLCSLVGNANISDKRNIMSPFSGLNFECCE
jgi:hypothetical protein